MKVPILSLAALLMLLPTAKASITFDVTYNSSLTAADQLAIQAALTEISSSISSPNNITVSLYYTTMSGGLGESTTSFVGLTYQQYYSAFATVATQPDQLTALASLGPAPTGADPGNPLTGGDQIDVTTAEARNLGFSTATGGVSVLGNDYDSEIMLNTSVTYPDEPNNGSNYGLTAVANHETDEALGIGGSGSTIGGTGFFANPGDLDLYRYTCSDASVATTLVCPAGDASRVYSTFQTTNPYSYFSIDGGNTVVSFFSQTTGSDYGDWLSNCTNPTFCTNGLVNGFNPQVQDAFGQPGTNPTLGANELTAFNAIGYDVISPEPSTLALTGLALALGCGFVRRRRRGA